MGGGSLLSSGTSSLSEWCYVYQTLPGHMGLGSQEGWDCLGNSGATCNNPMLTRVAIFLSSLQKTWVCPGTCANNTFFHVPSVFTWMMNGPLGSPRPNGLKVSSPDPQLLYWGHLPPGFYLMWFQQAFVQHSWGVSHCGRQRGQRHAHETAHQQRQACVPCTAGDLGVL